MPKYHQMPKFRTLGITTGYWKPGDDYLDAIIKALETKVANHDFVVISEKALATALGNIADEVGIKPSLNARLLARFWMRVCWGYVFSAILGFGRGLTQNLREYPLSSGSSHKQLTLEMGGPLQALLFGSEGAIDGSNLPYSFVSLPMKDAEETAANIRQKIWSKLNRTVTVVIVDTDKTFTFHNFHFTPRPKPICGIHGNGGIVAYLVGRLLKLRRRSTPIAVAGQKLPVEEALRIANMADRARGPGSGTTVWKMARRFGVPVSAVTWEMLSLIKHKPIVLVRSNCAHL